MGKEEGRAGLLLPGRPSMDKYRCGGELKLVHRHRLQQIPNREDADDRTALQDTQMAGVVMLHEIGSLRNWVQRTAILAFPLA